MGCEVLKYVLHASHCLWRKLSILWWKSSLPVHHKNTFSPQKVCALFFVSSSLHHTSLSYFHNSSQTYDSSHHAIPHSIITHSFCNVVTAWVTFNGKFTFHLGKFCFIFKSTVEWDERNGKIGVGFLLIFFAPTSWKCLFAAQARKNLFPYFFKFFRWLRVAFLVLIDNIRTN